MYYPDCLLWMFCPSFPVLMSCPSCPVLMSCPSCPVLAVLLQYSYPQLACPCCPVVAAMSRLSWSFCSVQADLSRLTCQVTLSRLTCPSCHAPGDLFLLLSFVRLQLVRFSYLSYPLLAIMFWLSCSLFSVLAELF